MLTEPRPNRFVLVHGDRLFRPELTAPDRTDVEIGHSPKLGGGESPKCDVCGALALRPAGNPVRRRSELKDIEAVLETNLPCFVGCRNHAPPVRQSLPSSRARGVQAQAAPIRVTARRRRTTRATAWPTSIVDRSNALDHLPRKQSDGRGRLHSDRACGPSEHWLGPAGIARDAVGAHFGGGAHEREARRSQPDSGEGDRSMAGGRTVHAHPHWQAQPEASRASPPLAGDAPRRPFAGLRHRAGDPSPGREVALKHRVWRFGGSGARRNGFGSPPRRCVPKPPSSSVSCRRRGRRTRPLFIARAGAFPGCCQAPRLFRYTGENHHEDLTVSGMTYSSGPR